MKMNTLSLEGSGASAECSQAIVVLGFLWVSATELRDKGRVVGRVLIDPLCLYKDADERLSLRFAVIRLEGFNYCVECVPIRFYCYSSVG